MPKMFSFPVVTSCFIFVVILVAAPVRGNDTFFENRVINTSSNSNASLGDPLDVSWSLVPDGTVYQDDTTNFIVTLDDAFGVAAANRTSDFTQRPWFNPIQNALDSYTNKSGLTYRYEPADDGAEFSLVNGADNNTGIAGVRGDLRIAGAGISTTFGGVSAVPRPNLSSLSPIDRGHSGILLNTDFRDGAFDAGSVDFLITHENLHAVGSQHIRVNESNSLSAVTGRGGTSEGPQFTDLLTLQRRYGDALEKNGGNDSVANATLLGSLSQDSPLTLGFDAGVGTATSSLTVANDDVDFVSIDDVSDTDVFGFTVTGSDDVVIDLTPRGPSYSYTNELIDLINGERTVFNIDASSLSNLSLTVLDSNGNVVEFADTNGLGLGESITLSQATGDFFVQINGAAEETQFYALEITSVASTVPEPSTLMLLGLAGLVGATVRRRHI